jgi:carbamoyl-phosphate synthase large subunit
MISAMGLPVTMTTKKLSEGHPNVMDVINDGSVGAVINTLSGVSDVLRDGFYIRRAAVEKQIPCFTSLDTARAAVESLLVGNAAYSIGTTRDYLNGH